jgi:hypothetical protein
MYTLARTRQTWNAIISSKKILRLMAATYCIRNLGFLEVHVQLAVRHSSDLTDLAKALFVPKRKGKKKKK